MCTSPARPHYRATALPARSSAVPVRMASCGADGKVVGVFSFPTPNAPPSYRYTTWTPNPALLRARGETLTEEEAEALDAKIKPERREHSSVIDALIDALSTIAPGREAAFLFEVEYDETAEEAAHGG